jgi:hypothetical protein
MHKKFPLLEKKGMADVFSCISFPFEMIVKKRKSVKEL